MSLATRAFNALVQIGSVLFLARLLSPEDYGLVSMVTAITGFAPSLVDLGTRDAIVQRSRIEEKEVSALFWITIAVGTGSAVLASACSPLIAKFYHEPRLVAITVVSSLTFIVTALTCQHSALLRRAMKFKDLGVIDVLANVLSAICAISMAFMGFHYWALVLRPVIMYSLTALGVWIRCSWIPSRPVMNKEVKDMVKFGLNTAGFTLTDFGSRSSDRIAIGYRTGARALGLYQNAMFVYDNLLDVLVFPLHSVAVSSLSKVRDDLKEFKRLWSKGLSTLAFYAMPAFGLLAVISKDLIILLLGSKWALAGVLLSVLALRGIPHTIERTLGWLHVTAGRSDRWMKWGVFTMIIQFIAMLIGLQYGPLGIVIAYVITTFVLFIPALAYAGNPLGIGSRDVVRAIWRQLVGCLAAGAVGFALRNSVLPDVSAVVRTALLTVAYAATYLVTVIGILRVREPVAVAMALLKDALPTRYAHLVKIPRSIEAHGYEHP